MDGISEELLKWLLGGMAERQRRYKERLRRGALIVPVEVEPLDGAALVDCGLLSSNEVEDRDAIVRAIRHWLDGLRASI